MWDRIKLVRKEVKGGWVRMTVVESRKRSCSEEKIEKRMKKRKKKLSQSLQ